MVGLDIAVSMTGGLDRLLRPARHPMMQLLTEGRLTAEDILSVEPLDVEDAAAGVAGTADARDAGTAAEDSAVAEFVHGLAAGLDRLLRFERHPMVLLLGETPLTVEDILAVPQNDDARDADGSPEGPPAP